MKVLIEIVITEILLYIAYGLFFTLIKAPAPFAIAILTWIITNLAVVLTYQEELASIIRDYLDKGE